MKTTIKSILLPLVLLASSILADEVNQFHSTIPVVDLNEFYNPETKQKFVDEVARACHEIGFFAVVNPDIPFETLQEAYKTSEAFFRSPLELKKEILDPELNGQRGFVLSETAQGQKKKDWKEFIHVGREGNLWPTWIDLKTPILKLIESIDRNSEALQRAFALAIGEDEEFFLPMTRDGQCLLRLIYYPKNPAPGTHWAAKHTDIGFFTILPMATEEGLQVYHDGEWIDVKVPQNAFIVNCGDKLENMTNGYFKSSLHQVVSKPNVERFSNVYFVHPRDDDSVSPTENSIVMTGGVQRFPNANSLELLACRLRELSLASPALLEYEKNSGIMDRISALVESGDAAEPVQLIYKLWKAKP